MAIRKIKPVTFDGTTITMSWDTDPEADFTGSKPDPYIQLDVTGKADEARTTEVLEKITSDLDKLGYNVSVKTDVLYTSPTFPKLIISKVDKKTANDPWNIPVTIPPDDGILGIVQQSISNFINPKGKAVRPAAAAAITPTETLESPIPMTAAETPPQTTFSPTPPAVAGGTVTIDTASITPEEPSPVRGISPARSTEKRQGGITPEVLKRAILNALQDPEVQKKIADAMLGNEEVQQTIASAIVAKLSHRRQGQGRE